MSRKQEEAKKNLARMKAHEAHRLRVKNAKAIVDDEAPILHAGNYARFGSLKQDIHTFFNHHKHNFSLLVNLNRTNRTKGVIDTFHIKSLHAKSQVPRMQSDVRQIENRNIKFGKRLLCVTGTMSRHFERKIVSETDKINEDVILPLHLLNKYKKYRNVCLPTDIFVLRKLMRPIIYFKLEVKGYRPLGNVCIQLYTEAAPQVVMEFIRLCLANDNERITFVRLFLGLWAEAELSLQYSTLIHDDIEYDMRAINHGEFPGILSFNMDTYRLYPHEKLNFTISFKPLSILNGHRIGFGRIVRGGRCLSCMQDYSTKNGKPIKQILITKCGVLDIN